VLGVSPKIVPLAARRTRITPLMTSEKKVSTFLQKVSIIVIDISLSFVTVEE
jgi:hypothetical protein